MWKNFIWQREDEPQNMLAYVFLLMNFVYGVTFTFFSDSSVVQSSAFAVASLPPELWGLACLLLVAGTLASIAFRPRFIGEVMGFLGVIVWCYGMVLYLAVDLFFAAAAIYVPQILFWTFWYIGVKRFYAREDRMTNELD